MSKTLVVVTTLSLVAFLAFAISCRAAPAGAAFPDVVSVKVSLAGLNSGDPAGVTAALARIRRAAATVCGERPSPVDLDSGAQYRACMNTTVGHALASLGGPAATACPDNREPQTFVASR